MNAYDFYKQYGPTESRRIAELAGTSFKYFKHIVYGERRPSIKLADKLVAASDGRLGFVALLRCKKDPK